MSGLQVIKLTDFIREVGEDEARNRLSSFSCAGLNNEVESYLTNGAFRHSRKRTSIILEQIRGIRDTVGGKVVFLEYEKDRPKLK